ncbi:tetratricopeptide repeat protein [Streptomyces aurantiacus]|uniref:Uncharacterized protein n=1 Tax=Streptomyces aurantiacus JA 4570 TaxID=1286094 RepID=S3ZNZ5_9ACTN|nr:tetratricopeptide repeat protein [Streptomyces aurantiacus]EPH44928.1 hypothetical protein STRAU_2025 [Streptomyces aurantiacus JA 4570]
MVGHAWGNRLEGAVVGGHSLQVGAVHGDVSVVGGAGSPARQPPATPVRVRDADPFLLGVHRPIRLRGSDPAPLPGYVPRDLDGPGSGGLRDLMTAGRFVLLVGSSSVGKTRSLYEAVRDRLPDWSLLQPADTRQLTELCADPPERLVLWLDELQNHLGGSNGLTASVLRELLVPGRSILVVATLWPHLYDTYTGPPNVPGGGARQDVEADDDPHRGERELLKLADVVQVGAGFTAAERERADAVAGDDARLRAALESTDFGLTQVIAGAPQLVHRWESADPYARGLLTAAVDATLLGARAPLPAALLRAAVPGYCTAAERGGAPEDWFEAALAYATRQLLGATAPLVPVTAGLEMGHRDGYRVADYLVQYVGRARRAVPPPQTFWDACAGHLTDTADARRTGAAAVARQRFAAAVPLLRRAADAGDVGAMRDLGELYRRTGDADAAQEMADRLEASEDSHAALYRVLLAGWDFEELLDLAEAGNDYAIGHVIEYGHPRLAMSLLLEHMDPDDLGAWYRLAELLRDEGEDQRAIDILELVLEREPADAPDDTVLFLTELLKQEGREERLRELTEEQGYFWAAHQLADLLHERGRTDEAVDLLWDFADQGSMDVDDFLADLLAGRGDLDQLLTRADEGCCRSAVKAAELLRARGADARARALLAPFADAGEVYASAALAKLSADADGSSGGAAALDDLRERARSGDWPAIEELARRLFDAGDVEEALRLASGHGSSSLERELTERLTARGMVDRAVRFLEELADSGEPYWTHRLADFLKDHGLVDALRARVDRGDAGAAWKLHDLLKEQGEDREAAALVRFGLTADGRVAVEAPGSEPVSGDGPGAG